MYYSGTCVKEKKNRNLSGQSSLSQLGFGLCTEITVDTKRSSECKCDKSENNLCDEKNEKHSIRIRTFLVDFLINK
jgi:hypothetical protein